MPRRDWHDYELLLDVGEALRGERGEAVEAQVRAAAQGVRAWRSADLDRALAAAETAADEGGGFRFPAGRTGSVRIEMQVGGRRFAKEWITR